MADELQDATNLPGEPDARRSPAMDVVRALAERLGGEANARAVFADPVERDGVTVIPVAHVAWLMGGGGGSAGVQRRAASSTPDGGEGAGGGGAARARAIGYIELRHGRSRFVPITEPSAYALPILAGGVGAWLVLRGLRHLFARH
jgi:uncharacterized spore protein YtfJ